MEMVYKFVPKSDYSDLLTKISSDLRIPQYVTTKAIKTMRDFQSRNTLSGDPKGYAGACLYHACKTIGMPECKAITQSGIATTIKMTEVTIRKRMKEIKQT
jgi:transcription initiation factor TFIIIB Brf1 subunit/transcription initiation factor TFIIB